MNMPEMFAKKVFDDKKMKDRLDSATYLEFKRCADEEIPLSQDIADKIATAMKDWAMENGVTHFTHWFQPMTGITAEKHDSFINCDKTGEVIMEFSGKELIKGEPDASSFPSGGLRATFEARGYTAWDPTSYAFIKDGILCIPTAFCSYNGYALDKKTPLLRSMEAISNAGKNLLRLFDKDVDKINVNVGPEQEYFLIDKAVYEKRCDLFYTGRTLFGAVPPKGQEMSDHYFGAIKPRVVDFMKELDEELWQLGILAKTKHNEVAPAQHEFAPIFTTVNIATDQNQLTMEIMRKLASKHNMACLLHEKPFKGVNGSGKHNNWSLSTSDGTNLLDPGTNPQDNAQFLLVLSAIIAAVEKHQDLLRISVSSAGNDHRLGAHEAPPAIIAMFLGDELTGILEAIQDGRTRSKRAKCQVEIGVHVLPKFNMDSTDRNRTSPLAFTGNKFEFRMPGSAFSIAGINMVLNTIVAEMFDEFYDRLKDADDLNAGINEIIKDVMVKHGKIIFNGNNYSHDWTELAKERGLMNLETTMDALPLYSSKKNMALFKKYGIFNEAELSSRQDILIENYSMLINIEASTMDHITSKRIIPAVIAYKSDLAATALRLKDLGLNPSAEIGLLAKLNDLTEKVVIALDELNLAHANAKSLDNDILIGLSYAKEVVPKMDALRDHVDALELITSKQYWPLPTYGDMLFSVL